MSELAAQTADGEFSLEIEADAWNEIERLCLGAGERETGGILIGRYTTDRSTAVVLEATPPPPDSHRARATFIRGIVGLRELLQRRWRNKDRRYYLGEWHYHPAAIVDPSSVDIDQMILIAKARDYRCQQPVLLIVGCPAKAGGSRPTRALVFTRSGPMEMRTV